MTHEHGSPGEAGGRSAAHRWRLHVFGAVQGVGYRPFVYRLAVELGLGGWVRNESGHVTIEVEGSLEQLEAFRSRLRQEAPEHARVERISREVVPVVGESGFLISHSADSDRIEHMAVVPDLATCSVCHEELFNPDSRRFRYPFISCAYCGPRWSIAECQPYDRANTSMRDFPLCSDCQKEYGDPQNRRFHAETQACPACGPGVVLWDARGRTVAFGDRALMLAAQALRSGQIITVKGIGGFHLCVDARNEAAVVRLRERKHREAKPLAVLAPGLEWVRRHCELSAREESWLLSAVKPIVLVSRKQADQAEGEIAPSIAPENPELGVMLPYSPLHSLIVAEVGGPLVATSGNRSGEPICREEQEALERLSGIVDGYLVHNRRIVRTVEDSVVRLAQGRLLVLRRARGMVPKAVRLPRARTKNGAQRVLGLGAELKSTVALSVGDTVQVSGHLGDWETLETRRAVEQAVQDLLRFHRTNVDVVATDLHPDFGSTRLAAESGLPVAPVAHHLAHVLASMADSGIAPPALGIAWDGFGLGPDRNLWGGEFLLVQESSWHRVACLRPFALPGGEAAAREGWRVALALLRAACGEGFWTFEQVPAVRSLTPAERRVFAKLLRSPTLSPPSSSVGRMFDGISALLGICQRSRFEGEAAMRLEFAARKARPAKPYPVALSEGPELQVDWRPMIQTIVRDIQARVEKEFIARRFHVTLVEGIVKVAEQFPGLPVVLAGGCFQNRLLLESVVSRLERSGRTVAWPKSFPPNDGAIALGQVVAVRWGLVEPQACSLSRGHFLPQPAAAGSFRNFVDLAVREASPACLSHDRVSKPG